MCAYCFERPLHGALQRLAQREHALEQQQHQQEEQRQTEKGLKQHPVDAVGELLRHPFGNVDRCSERGRRIDLDPVVGGKSFAHHARRHRRR